MLPRRMASKLYCELQFHALPDALGNTLTTPTGSLQAIRHCPADSLKLIANYAGFLVYSEETLFGNGRTSVIYGRIGASEL